MKKMLALALAAFGGLGQTAPIQAADEQGWTLVWSDEFSGPDIDRRKWGFEVDCWGGGNREHQCYTDSPRNAGIEDGKLVISARHERTTGPALPAAQRRFAAMRDEEATRSFSSARLTSMGKASWLYGKIEVRARLPQGQGTWPAIWMLPEEDHYGAWAASGEIDILEAVNLGVACAACAGGREDTILGTLHFGGKPPENRFAGTEIHFPEVLDGFHTYAIEWAPDQIVWLVDGRVYAQRNASEWSTTGSSDAGAPFDRPFHLILNLAIGGGLPESRGLGGVQLDGYPKRMEVDWVHVWKKAAGPASDTSGVSTAGGD
jgi:beta-glucanase (GH16 family)